MNKVNLLEKFIEILNAKYPKRHELVSVVEEKLAIERESASRRVSGKVQFTMREVGILAHELDISLDNLLYSEEYNSVPFLMQAPCTAHSMDILIKQMGENISKLESICNNTTEVGSIFNSLPAKLYIPHPKLAKFMHFKWGHYFIGSKEFRKYESWRIPDNILAIHDRIMNIQGDFKKVFCFWDISLIWNLVKDIEYFYKIHAINRIDVELIQHDLLGMLDYVEAIAKGTGKENLDPEIIFYISSVHLGMTYTYFLSNTGCASSFNTYFIRSIFSENHETCMKVRDWIISMKKVSTLISGSGEKERILFFEEQRKIVNSIPINR